MTDFQKETLRKIEDWNKDKNLSIITSETAIGQEITIDGKLSIIAMPQGESSEQLRQFQKEARADGRQLYYFYEWDTDFKKMFNHFESKLGLDTRKYAAKRLNISIIDNKIADMFMKSYHIQGSARGTQKTSIALLEPVTNEILAVQQFAKYRFSGSRGKGSREDSNVWEGLRLCFKPGVQIYGGASRLQKFFEKSYEPEKIIGYISASHSDGAYKGSQGFELEEIKSQVAYMWVLATDPKIVPIVDKNGVKRVNDVSISENMPLLNPVRLAGAFGKGVGQTFYGGKLGSRKELREHPENGELVHNDVIIEAIGYRKFYTPGQYKWVKYFIPDETEVETQSGS